MRDWKLLMNANRFRVKDRFAWGRNVDEWNGTLFGYEEWREESPTLHQNKSAAMGGWMLGCDGRVECDSWEKQSMNDRH